MKAKSEVIGTEANAEPQKELRLASSETATKTTAEIKILRAYDHMDLLHLTVIIETNGSVYY